MKITITGMNPAPDNQEADSFADYNRYQDQAGWVGRGCTEELPADGTWAGGNGADMDGADNPAAKLYKHANKTVGPEGLLDKGNSR